jgi:hypothetical protein
MIGYYHQKLKKKVEKKRRNATNWRFVSHLSTPAYKIDFKE